MFENVLFFSLLTIVICVALVVLYLVVDVAFIIYVYGYHLLRKFNHWVFSDVERPKNHHEANDQ